MANFNAAEALAGTPEYAAAHREAEESAEANIEETEDALKAYNLEDFLALDIKPRDTVMDPIIPTQGLVMAYSPRGVGKTYFALEIGYATASGGAYLKWNAPQARRVLYVDGELPAVVIQERLARIVGASQGEPPAADYFQILTPDLQEVGIGNISTPNGQQRIEAHLDGVDLLILDSLSTLCQTSDENAAEEWGPVQAWMLRLRRQGVSVLLLHHSGKSGAQRGTSRREDVLDTVISLRRPKDYTPDEGCRFEVHYEKARTFHGEQCIPFEVALSTVDEVPVWTVKMLADVREQQILALKDGGLTQRDISKELSIGLATVNRCIKKAEIEGRL